MSAGFRRDDNDRWQSKCPMCGRFVSEDSETAFYCHEFDDDDFVSLFCSEAHAEGYPHHREKAAA